MKKPLAYVLIMGLLLGSLTPSAANGEEVPASNGNIASFKTSSLIKTDGTFWVWGGFQQETVPTQIVGLSDVERSFEGQYVKLKDGSLWRWERDRTSSTGFDLQKVEEIEDPVDVIGGYNDNYILDSKGQVYEGYRTEGSDNYQYELLDGIEDVAEMTSYYDYPNGTILVFLKKDGSVWRTVFAEGPIVPSTEIKDAVHVEEEVVLLKDGSVREWTVEYDPDNLSLNWKDELSKPVEVLPALKSVWSNGTTNLGIDGQQRLWFWGATVIGFSDSTSRHEQPAPVRLTNVKNVKEAYAMDRTLFVLTNEGKVYEASIERTSMPTDVEFTLLATDVIGLSPGSKTSILQKNDGTLWGWGLNKYGSLGSGSINDRQTLIDVPVQVQAPIEVVLNGESIALSNGVITRSGQAFVPLRSIFEKLGAKIAWDAENKIATLERVATDKNSSITVQLNFKNGMTKLNGAPVSLPNELFSSAGSSYLPLRFISESLGAKVDWQQKGGKILITLS